jgi:hypothetical protein
MRKLLPLLVVFVCMSGCPCRQTGVIQPDPACHTGDSTCLNGRPYACGGGAWRPIGTVDSCASLGTVCCVDRETNVHACVTQDRCALVPAPAPVTDAGGN